MKLSASRLAQWFVQGDHYSIRLDESRLVFESKHITETVPFSIWDGQCRISRGLWWGKLTVIVSPADRPAQTLTVYGLPWRELQAFAEQLTGEYQVWLAGQQKRFMLVEHELFALRDMLAEHQGFLRDADLTAWREKADAVFEAHTLHPQVFSIANPALYQAVYGWIQNGDAMREARNQRWQDNERERWSAWFDEAESSPLNASQRDAVLMDDNHNLLLAGAGSGKTSVLIARTRYLVTGEQTTPERILMLAFGKKASDEMKARLQAHQLNAVNVSTFHSFATKIIKEATGQAPVMADLAIDEESKLSWMTVWLAKNLANPTVEKRWQKHLTQWKVSGLSADRPLVEQAHEPKLHKWLWRQLDLLQQQTLSQTAIKQRIQALLPDTSENDDESMLTPEDAKKKDIVTKAMSELALVWPLVRDYRQHLSQSKTFDFNGLIIEATKILSKKNATLASHYDHVMVDEYQDISPSRLALLEAVCGGKRDRAPSLFAVGDDWQAIYRFAGSDVSLTTDFLTRFPKGNIRYLDTTYRFNAMLGDVANRFIQVNPSQLSKPLNSHRQQKKKAVTLLPTESIAATLEKLASSQGDKSASVLIIGRNNANKPADLSQWQSSYSSLDIHYVTAHASKGLEADYTFIVDMNENVFPARSYAEGLEGALLHMEEGVEHAEERRLFYVALTRAKHQCWVCCEPDSASVFVKELWQGDYPVASSIAKKQLMAS
ncbi:DNA helicase IV [Enterovibrio baiacu]|uniref:DNA helicase IV n=1 Tax=Enterovibrio baiacu TaxID=2491023 RepID=UPI003D137DBF